MTSGATGIYRIRKSRENKRKREKVKEKAIKKSKVGDDMLLTKESGYAIRIVRVLGDGDKKNIKDICTEEEIPEAFGYKILKKLNKSGIIEIVRGAKGGYKLLKPAEKITLFDVVEAVDPSFAVMECIKEGCPKIKSGYECKLHAEMIKIQTSVEALLKEKTIEDILNR